MQELEERCKEAGIVVMNEIGLDPGLDHLCEYLGISPCSDIY
jgi:saccharopine dehydrogenase-like NADP-dependent oxidoreductase